jgi:DNA-binding CsgD family transcriptional regulator
VSLTLAQAALDRCDWERAHALAAAAATREPAAEARRHDVMADALWWLGRIDECIEARHSAYTRYEASGDAERAGQAAVWLYEHHCFRGRSAIGGAWLRRARRALEEHPECVAYGNLLLREAEASHSTGALEDALVGAGVALELGRRLRSPDLEAEALQTIGRLLIDTGRAADGLAHLDEAMLLAVEGRLGPYATGKVYCSLIGACEDLGDLRRASEWTDATIEWSKQHPFAVFPGLCRVKRAYVLQWRGEWEQAEREARRACDELAAVKVNSAAAAWVEVGEIRRRTGDLDGAEEAFGRARELCCTPASGLALLRLAQGRVHEAGAIVDEALRDQSWNRLARARLLPAKVQVALAAGALDAATAAAAELESIAGDYDSAALRATARVERGRVELAADHHDAARRSLRQAVEDWQALDVPYETATAQLLLSQACAVTGDAEGEARWLDVATRTFRRLGAAYDARAASGVPVARSLPCGLSEREGEVLRRVAEGLTNKELATELSLSEKTVARHLSNIFAKIGVSTRSAATAFAFERGIVGSRT